MYHAMETGVTTVGTFVTHNIPETYMHTYRILQSLHVESVDNVMYKDTVAGITTGDWRVCSHFISDSRE